MSDMDTRPDLKDLGRLAADLAFSTGVAYHEAMGGLLAATMMAERLDDAEAKLDKIQAYLDGWINRPVGVEVIQAILDEEPQA